MWRGKILSTCLECEWGTVNSRRSGRKRKTPCPVIFQDCEPTRRAGESRRGEGSSDKPPCCQVSLAVLLANKGVNFIYMCIHMCLIFPFPLAAPGRCVSRAAWWHRCTVTCGPGITRPDLAISLGQSVKWSWRLFLLSRCTSRFFLLLSLCPQRCKLSLQELSLST